jgi:Ferritin-like domain
MTDSTSRETGQPTDGVVAELARDDVERKRFLKMAGRTMGAGAAATALGTFIAACGGSSTSSSGSAASAPAASPSSTSAGTTTTAQAGGDLAIVNYALTLEYLEDQFYDKVVHSGLFKGRVLATLRTFGSEEHQHTLALHSVAMKLGTPAPKPRGKFPITTASEVAKLAATVENLGAAAYLGQAAAIKSPEILAAALSIHTVEARHAATLNLLLNMTPTQEGAFAGPATMAQVLAKVKPFIA